MTPQQIQMMISWGWIILMFVVFYFAILRPQKKREKKDREMINSIKVGDQVVTIGGIYGKIITIKDDNFTLETGADRTKLSFKKWAIRNIETNK